MADQLSDEEKKKLDEEEKKRIRKEAMKSMISTEAGSGKNMMSELDKELAKDRVDRAGNLIK